MGTEKQSSSSPDINQVRTLVRGLIGLGQISRTQDVSGREGGMCCLNGERGRIEDKRSSLVELWSRENLPVQPV